MILRRDVLRFGQGALGAGLVAGAPMHGGGWPAAFPALARASEAPPPTLTVSGLIGADGLDPDGEGKARHFTLEGLEGLGLVGLTTTTPWTKGPQYFAGVPLAVLLAEVQVRGPMLHLVAINDYRAEMPVADAAENGAFLATRLDGHPMRIRDFGPVWMIYPWSQRPELDSPTFHRRAVWQLAWIEVR